MPNNLNAHSIQAKCNLEMVTSFSICLDCSTSLLPFFKTAHVSSCLEILILNFCEFIFTKEIETCLKPRPWRTSQALAARPPILQWFIKYMEAYHSWERHNKHKQVKTSLARNCPSPARHNHLVLDARLFWSKLLLECTWRHLKSLRDLRERDADTERNPAMGELFCGTDVKNQHFPFPVHQGFKFLKSDSCHDYLAVTSSQK